jgi:hypothetical protein
LLISYQFLLIFTLIFTLKTNKSYKITIITTTNHSIFQKNLQKSLFSNFFLFFYSLFPFALCSGVYPPHVWWIYPPELARRRRGGIQHQETTVL